MKAFKSETLKIIQWEQLREDVKTKEKRMQEEILDFGITGNVSVFWKKTIPSHKQLYYIIENEVPPPSSHSVNNRVWIPPWKIQHKPQQYLMEAVGRSVTSVSHSWEAKIIGSELTPLQHHQALTHHDVITGARIRHETSHASHSKATSSM